MKRSWTLALCALLGTAGAVRAQTPVEPCSYTTCALRVRMATLTSPQTLVRGQDDVLVVSLGLFKPAITPHFARSEEAVRYSLIYDRLYDRGSVLNIIGTIVTIGAPLMAETTARKITFTLVGIGLSMYGGMVINDANDALARAVWWHNSALDR